MCSGADHVENSFPFISCRIIIIGGGLGGLATSIALRRNGHEVIVLERMPVMREIGAGIQVPPNASKILADWGLLEAIQAQALQPYEANMRSYRDGAILSTTKLLGCADSVDALFGPHLVVYRPDLIRVLSEKAVSLGVTIRLSSDVSGIDFAAPSLKLSTGETYTADVIVGADGERSICQRLLRGFDDPPQDSGDEIFRFTAKTTEVIARDDLTDLVEPPKINFWVGPEAHVITYSMKNDELFNVVLTRAHRVGDKVMYGPQPAEPEELRKAFGGWDSRLHSLLDIADACSKRTLLVSNEVPKWTSEEGLFTLLGDAAHAMLPFLGQGAAQAFEDADVLGLLFGKITKKSEIPELLSTFEAVRKPRTNYLCKRSIVMRDNFAIKDGEQQRLRDHQLLHEEPFEGSANIYSDPIFRKTMWDYDAASVVAEATRQNASNRD